MNLRNKRRRLEKRKEQEQDEDDEVQPWDPRPGFADIKETIDENSISKFDKDPGIVWLKKQCESFFLSYSLIC